MKVTVYFGETRVVVPCGHGEFLVSELIERAVLRYKKAAGKPNDYYVHVHTLKSQSDGGILDLDDQLSDVVDDREQIVAEYEEQGGPSAPQGGDGSSGSNSTSPDVFQTNRKLMPLAAIKTSTPTGPRSSTSGPAIGKTHVWPPPKNSVTRSEIKLPPGSSAAKKPSEFISARAVSQPGNNKPVVQTQNSVKEARPHISVGRPSHPVGRASPPTLSAQPDVAHSVEVTEKDLNAGTGLQVLSVRRGSEPNLPPPTINDDLPSKVQKQWPKLPEESAPQHTRSASTPIEVKKKDSLSDDEEPGLNRFARDSSRHSLTGQNVLKWASAQERQENIYRQQQNGRKEPLGQSRSPGEEEQRQQPQEQQQTHLVVLKNEEGPLGIHVMPHRSSENDKESGLVIQGIQAGGRIHRCGHFCINDVIDEINGKSLRDATFTQAQEIFRDALQADELRLRIIKNGGNPSQYATSGNDSMERIADTGQRRPSDSNTDTGPRRQQGPPPPPVRSSTTSLTSQTSPPTAQPSVSPNNTSSKALLHANTKKMGKKIYIELVKGPEGLGFSITTRDNPAGGVAPIYVKNILPKGAAIADGRLKSGDRLMEVNGMDMTGKSQDEAVAILRNTKRGSTVTLCISRQDSSTADNNALPRQLQLPASTPTAERLFANAARYNSLLASTCDDDDTIDKKECPPQVKQDDGNLVTDREVLVFNIPLNETGSAGLGVSVKGKTTSNENTQDLGIFIKAVIHGGAASKDGRLQINDQLLAVNNDDLKEKSNSEAMEALRQAMHSEGPTPGHIKLCIARRYGDNSSGSTPEPLESTDSNAPPPTQMEAVRAEPVVTEVSLKAPAASKLAAEELSPPIVLDQIRNPVLDRLTGTADVNKLRNESYNLATTDSDKEDSYEPPSPYSGRTTIPTPQPGVNNSELMMIEDDNQKMSAVLHQPRRKEVPEAQAPVKSRPFSTIGSVGIAETHKSASKQSSTVSPAETPTDDQNMNTFDREAFGRRSFSEKRKASNGKNKEVVEKVKALREEMNKGQLVEKSTSRPSNIRPSTLDYSVTSAYEPTSSPVLLSPLSPMLRTSSTQHYRPTQPPPFSRTFSSTTCSATTTNGRRPIPAPRKSISSSQSDYQTIDDDMPDVQVKKSILTPPGNTALLAFTYPSSDAVLQRASTLPIATTRPNLDLIIDEDHVLSSSNNVIPANYHTYSVTKDEAVEKKQATNGSSPSESTTISPSSTLEKQSQGSKRSLPLRRGNSKSSLNDSQKKERRKSDLIGISPYPQFYNLAGDMEETNPAKQAAPIYSQIRKVSDSTELGIRGTNSSTQRTASHQSPSTNHKSPILSPNSPIYERLTSMSPRDPETRLQDDDTGPTLGLQKNSSFESLQAMVEENSRPVESTYHKPPTRVARGRGCNESFRAAVDRSYEPDEDGVEQMEPAPGQKVRRSLQHRSASAHVNSERSRRVTEEQDGSRNTPIISSLTDHNMNDNDDKKKSKKQKNSFLDMFRFGKNRKSMEERSPRKVSNKQKQDEMNKARQFHQAEQDSGARTQDSDPLNRKESQFNPAVQDMIQEHYKRLQEKQKHQAFEQHPTPEYSTFPRNRTHSHEAPPVPPHTTDSHGEGRGDKLANIRAQHQKRHQDRQGRYPGEAHEDFYERKIRQREKEWEINNRDHYGNGTDSYNPRGKPLHNAGASNTNRYSFYAEPRFSDYHRIGGGANDYYPIYYNQKQNLYNARQDTVYNSLPKHSQREHQHVSSSNSTPPTAHHQRYRSQDSTPIKSIYQKHSNVPSQQQYDMSLSDYDDPRYSDNSLYAQVRKPPVGSVSHAARV